MSFSASTVPTRTPTPTRTPIPTPTPHAALLDGLNAPDLDFELDLPRLVRVLGGRS